MKSHPRRERFKAMLLEGHKQAAVEVPFDPAERWAIPARPLWFGRRGHQVRGTLNGTPFESAIVPRSRKFFLLVEEDVMKEAGVSVGDLAEAALEPVAPPEVSALSQDPGTRRTIKKKQHRTR